MVIRSQALTRWWKVAKAVLLSDITRRNNTLGQDDHIHALLLRQFGYQSSQWFPIDVPEQEFL
jgi:hypothetical protein